MSFKQWIENNSVIAFLIVVVVVFTAGYKTYGEILRTSGQAVVPIPVAEKGQKFDSLNAELINAKSQIDAMKATKDSPPSDATELAKARNETGELTKREKTLQAELAGKVEQIQNLHEGIAIERRKSSDLERRLAEHQRAKPSHKQLEVELESFTHTPNGDDCKGDASIQMREIYKFKDAGEVWPTVMIELSDPKSLTVANSSTSNVGAQTDPPSWTVAWCWYPNKKVRLKRMFVNPANGTASKILNVNADT